MSRTKMFLIAAGIFAVVSLVMGLHPIGILLMIGSAGFAIGSSIIVSEQKNGRLK